MINPQWLELPMSRTNFHGPKDVRAIEVRLYKWIYPHKVTITQRSVPGEPKEENEDQTKMKQNGAFTLTDVQTKNCNKGTVLER